MRKLLQVGEAQGMGCGEDGVLVEFEVTRQPVPQVFWHLVRDHEPDALPKPAALQLILYSLQEVGRLVLLDHEVRVAGHLEDEARDDLLAGEEFVQVRRDDLLDSNKAYLGPLAGSAVLVGESHKAVYRGRHLYAGHNPPASVPDHDEHIQREVGDVREGVCQVNGERREYGSMSLTNLSLSSRRSEARTLSWGTMRIPSSSRAGMSSLFNIPRRTSKNSSVWSCTLESCSSGVIPSGTGLGRSEATCCCNPATRIMKNSSRIVSQMATKRTLSRRGCRSSRACASTRSIKPRYESSLFMYNEGSERLGLRATSVISLPPARVASPPRFLHASRSDRQRPQCVVKSHTTHDTVPPPRVIYSNLPERYRSHQHGAGRPQKRRNLSRRRARRRRRDGRRKLARWRRSLSRPRRSGTTTPTCSSARAATARSADPKASARPSRTSCARRA